MARGERLDRLPGAAAEGRAIARALGSPVTLLTAISASEARVRSSLANARVIHFATHGVIRDDQPMASFLALGGSANVPDDDRRFTAAEVYELSLNADLVVLSACRSALGAQLEMIRELRAGKVSVDTPAGSFVLPEHPSLWAGLVLVGEP